MFDGAWGTAFVTHAYSRTILPETLPIASRERKASADVQK